MFFNNLVKIQRVLTPAGQTKAFGTVIAKEALSTMNREAFQWRSFTKDPAKGCTTG
jgi:hypothetical protein